MRTLIQDLWELKIDENYMRKVVIHNVIEAQHLNRFLPELYAEYHNQPDDVD